MLSQNSANVRVMQVDCRWLLSWIVDRYLRASTLGTLGVHEQGNNETVKTCNDVSTISSRCDAGTYPRLRRK